MELRTSSSNPDVGKFGWVRNGGTKKHNGLDLLAGVGDNVTSVDDGFVLDIQSGGAGGNLTKIGHNNADGELVSVSVYMHLNDVPNLEMGQAVSAGQVIGEVGRSGNITTEPTHLHFELRTRIFGGQIDPAPYLRIGGNQ